MPPTTGSRDKYVKPRSNLPRNKLNAAVKNGVVAPIVWSNETGIYETAAIEETMEIPCAALQQGISM